jgi:hypothetical protein
MVGGREYPARKEDVERRRALHRAAAGDGVEVRLVGPRPAPAPLGDVERDRSGGPIELIAQRREPAPRDQPRHQPLERERDLVDLEPLGIELRLAGERTLVEPAGARERVGVGHREPRGRRVLPLSTTPCIRRDSGARVAPPLARRMKHPAPVAVAVARARARP